MKLESLLQKLDYDDVVNLAVYEKVTKNEKSIKEIFKTAYCGENFEFALCKRKPLTRLVVVTNLLLKKYDEYKKKNIPDEIIFDTFRDVSLRANLYFRNTGKIGISKGDVTWFRHIMNVNIFKIGSIQFQPFEMVYLDEETIGEPYMNFAKDQKAILAPGSPIINCHIQRNADLSPEAVEKSFEKAKTFFNKYYSSVEYKAFLCYSWLLYPPMVNQLTDQSNIKRFAERFDIIGTCTDSEQAKECLFEKGKNNVGVNTSLQKMAMSHREYMGFACGIIKIH